MLFMRFPAEVPRRLVKFCEERLNTSTVDPATIANESSMRMSRLVPGVPEGSRRRTSVFDAISGKPNGSDRDAADDDDDVEDPNSQVGLQQKQQLDLLARHRLRFTSSVRARADLQVHLADLELDFSDVKFDNLKKGRAVQSDYLIILRVFLVFALPLLASMVSTTCPSRGNSHHNTMACQNSMGGLVLRMWSSSLARGSQ